MRDPPASAGNVSAKMGITAAHFGCCVTPLPIKRVWCQTLAVARLMAAISVRSSHRGHPPSDVTQHLHLWHVEKLVFLKPRRQVPQIWIFLQLLICAQLHMLLQWEGVIKVSRGRNVLLEVATPFKPFLLMIRRAKSRSCIHLDWQFKRSKWLPRVWVSNGYLSL